jgi:DNA (cytosine-5)-methyltransferase 1
MKKETPEKFTYISLFSSAGIGCYGFKLEDFECIATNEILNKRLDIQRYNDKCKYDSGYISGDVRLKEVKDAIYAEINLWKSKERIKEVDVVIATPPCQGMSVANHKKKEELDRNSLVVESIILTKKINPKFFIFENVRTFLNTPCTDVDGKLKLIKQSIEENLSNYNILFKIINFKDYGSPTQRTRTLVIGVRKDLKEITPFDLFPDKQKEKTLRQVIGDLKSLKLMGAIDSEDIFHNFRPYKENMLSWIELLKEGESAFDNSDKSRIPSQLIDGKRVVNQNKSSDKYQRCFWNKPGYCIHTRNDILASQWTIHPSDNRVFSIRELMIMMTIPEDFKWSNQGFNELNALSEREKRMFLKQEELNIRKSIGEAVPTIIFKQIALKIKNILNKNILSQKEIELIIEKENLKDYDNLIKFIKKNINQYEYPEISKISELSNAKRLNNEAYYTSQDICYSLIKDLPNFENKKAISILEPSVGVGNFLPLLLKKYGDIYSISIDLVDIDPNSIELLKILIKKLQIPSNFTINFITEDFLLKKFDKEYDLIIGNPPFKKLVGNDKLLKEYKKDIQNNKTNNLFSFFIEKALKNGNLVSFITPKSLLSAPEFNETRNYLNKKSLLKIIDFGEKAFKIKIETIGIIIKNEDKCKDNLTKIESYITNEVEFKKQDYICDYNYPYWLIYRNNFFDKVAEKIIFNIFDVFRDRQITADMYSSNGKIRVLKSRNIYSNEIKNIPGYDSYVDNTEGLAVKKFLNNQEVVLVPNLTYNPRACFKPKECIVNGSVAILTPHTDIKVSEKDLELYNTEEFNKFYSLSRNLSTRSMNIDSNSVFFFGKLKNGTN